MTALAQQERPSVARQPDEPSARLRRFHQATADLDWQQDTAGSIRALTAALVAIAEAEVRTYHDLRVRGRRRSFALRALMWALATLGGLAPLVASTGWQAASGAPAVGYVLLFLAAAIHSLDTLFGTSEGHVRFARTQLRLESEILRFQIIMIQNSTTHELDGDERLHQLLLACQAFVRTVGDILGSETDRWGADVARRLEEMKTRIDAHTPDGGGA